MCEHVQWRGGGEGGEGAHSCGECAKAAQADGHSCLAAGGCGGRAEVHYEGGAE